MQEKVIYRWFEVQPQVVELLASKGQYGEMVPKESIPDLLNHKNKSIERLAEEIWPLRHSKKKLADVAAQVLELRDLIAIAKNVAENGFMSAQNKAEFFQSLPNDLSAFADSLDEILADLHHDGFDLQAIDHDLIADEVLGNEQN